MTYIEAQRIKDDNQNLIGKVDSKGFTITEIIIVPSDANSREDFLRSYMFSKNAEISILPYQNDDLIVWAVDTKHLHEANVLFYSELPNE